MRLERRMAASGDKVLLFCGTLPGEGVRTTAMTAAHALGEMGKSVVLIDLDLKRGTDKRSPGLEACLFRALPGTGGAAPARCRAVSLTPRAAAGFHRARCSLLAKICAARNCFSARRRGLRFAHCPGKRALCGNSACGGKLRCGGVRHRAGSRIADERCTSGPSEKLLSCDVTVAGCVLNGVQAGLSGYGYGKYGYGYGYGKYGRYGHYGYGHYGAHRTREETV